MTEDIKPIYRQITAKIRLHHYRFPKNKIQFDIYTLWMSKNNRQHIYNWTKINISNAEYSNGIY